MKTVKVAVVQRWTAETIIEVEVPDDATEQRIKEDANSAACNTDLENWQITDSTLVHVEHDGKYYY
jgi:hypothetical protein